MTASVTRIRPYIDTPSVEAERAAIEDADLRRLIEEATAATVAHPARQWAPGTRPPKDAA